jgi:hypothetical protein
LSLLPWDEGGWFEDAAAWIDARVNTTGDLELLRTRPWSALIRVPTANGDAWFKEAAPTLAFEPPLTELLAQRQPGYVPAVLAIEGPRMLTADAGPPLRRLLDQGEPALSWEDIVAHYANVQIELAAAVDELLAIGVPDSRPETLGHPVRGALPMTLIHEEVHDGNVHLRDGQPVFIDWAEASVSHPFAGLVNTLRMVSWRSGWQPGGPEVLRLRDAYLEPWTHVAPLDELRDVFAEGYALGALARATTWERLLEPLSPSAREDYPHNVEAWREIYAEARGPDAKLGA